MVPAVFLIQGLDRFPEFQLFLRLQEDDLAAGIDHRGPGEDVIADPEIPLIQGRFPGAFQNDLAVFFR